MTVESRDPNHKLYTKNLLYSQSRELRVKIWDVCWDQWQREVITGGWNCPNSLSPCILNITVKDL